MQIDGRLLLKNKMVIVRELLFMKVGIVTFTFGDNYGQRLQNYAVQELLKVRGLDVSTIRQSEQRCSFKHRVKTYLTDCFTGMRKTKLKRHSSFVEFDEKYITYEPGCSLPDCPPSQANGFDAFVAGSDQIWSPYIPDNNGAMFLSFADNAKKISLSASIAAPKLPEEKKSIYKDRLSSFSFITVREDNAARMLKECSGLNAEVLIDPTLMLDCDVWNGLAKAPVCSLPQRYALKYFLGTDSKKVRMFEDYCMRTGLEVVDLLGDPRYFTCGPSEFIYLIKNSMLVATDSYHGSIFSILYGKPLLMFERSGSQFDMSDRFDTLEEKLGLGNWREANWESIKNDTLRPFDVTDHLQVERDRFNSFLNRALLD